MRSLVTGGNGFIGGHIVDELINRGHQVTVIDNLSSHSMKNFITIEKRSTLSLTLMTLKISGV